MSSQHKASSSNDKFLPPPFQTIEPNPQRHLEGVGTIPFSKKGEFAQEIDKLIKDVYSEVEVPFAPFRNQTTIPDWIFLQNPQFQGEGLKHVDSLNLCIFFLASGDFACTCTFV